MSKTQNRIIASIATAIVSVGFLSACGSAATDVPSGQASYSDPSEQKANPTDNIMEMVYSYNGKPLHCVTIYPGANSGRMSCDFVRYHSESESTAP